LNVLHQENLFSKEERDSLFRNTAAYCGLSPGIVEKDFWVCWTLNYLFHFCPWARDLVFKGGTSLSKCYGLIERFSEDIDLILDWRLLGYGIYEPWAERTRTKQDQFNKEANTKTETFLRELFLPRLREDFQRMLQDNISIYLDPNDPQTVCFMYPHIFYESSIINVIRLEIGALAAWAPAQAAMVSSYAAQRYPRAFSEPSVEVLTVASERTFWEKVTILHKEAFRINGEFPLRYSRHYYDLYCMYNATVRESAYSSLGLLEHVASFKDRFYHTAAAHYELAKPGTLRLMPPDRYMDAIHDDYQHMKNMIFGKKPEFEEILSCIATMEKDINKL
jgi:hypothetical protein